MTWSRQTATIERKLADMGYPGSTVAPTSLSHKGKWCVTLGPQSVSARYFDSLAEARMYVDYLIPEGAEEQL